MLPGFRLWSCLIEALKLVLLQKLIVGFIFYLNLNLFEKVSEFAEERVELLLNYAEVFKIIANCFEY